MSNHKDFVVEKMPDNTLCICSYKGTASVVSIPGSIDGLQVSVIGSNCFEWNDFVSEVQIPDGVICIEDSAFIFCQNLKSLSFPDTLRTIGQEAFGGCSNLLNIYIPRGLTEIKPYAFSMCEKIQKIEVDKANTVFRVVDGMLINTRGKTVVVCQKNLTGNIAVPNEVAEIENYAFFNCKTITGVSLPMRMTVIGENAFAECSELHEVNFPPSIQSIGTNAFDGCKNLMEVFLPINCKIGRGQFSPFNEHTTVHMKN